MFIILLFSLIFGKEIYLNYQTTTVVDTFENEIVNYELREEKNLSQCYFQGSRYQINIIDKIKVLSDDDRKAFEQYFYDGRSNYTQSESIVGLINITDGIILLTNRGQLKYINLLTKNIQTYQLVTPILDKVYLNYYQSQITIIADLITIVVFIDLSKDYIFLWNNQATHVFQLDRVLKLRFLKQMVYILFITKTNNLFKLLSYKIYGGSFEYIDMKDVLFANDLSVQQFGNINYIYIISDIYGVYLYVHNQTDNLIQLQQSEYLSEFKGQKIQILGDKLIIANQLNDHSFQISLFLINDQQYKIINMIQLQGQIKSILANYEFFLLNTQNSQYVCGFNSDTIEQRQILIQSINYPIFSNLQQLQDNSYIASTNTHLILTQYNLIPSKLICFLENEDKITLNLNQTSCSNQLQIYKKNTKTCEYKIEYDLKIKYPIVYQNDINTVVYIFGSIIMIGLLIIIFTIWYYLRYIILKRKLNQQFDETVNELKQSNLTFNQLMNSHNVSIPNLSSQIN